MLFPQTSYRDHWVAFMQEMYSTIISKVKLWGEPNWWEPILVFSFFWSQLWQWRVWGFLFLFFFNRNKSSFYRSEGLFKRDSHLWESTEEFEIMHSRFFLFFYGIKRFLQGNTTKFNIIMSYTLHKDTIKSLDIFQNMNPHIKHFREPSLFLTCCISSTESLNRQENNLFFFFFCLFWFDFNSTAE